MASWACPRKLWTVLLESIQGNKLRIFLNNFLLKSLYFSTLMGSLELMILKETLKCDKTSLNSFFWFGLSKSKRFNIFSRFFNEKASFANFPVFELPPDLDGLSRGKLQASLDFRLKGHP